MSELKEIDKIVGPALDKNKKLPKSMVCNQPDTVYLFNMLDARSSELSMFTSPCDGSRQQMTRMW